MFNPFEVSIMMFLNSVVKILLGKNGHKTRNTIMISLESIPLLPEESHTLISWATNSTIHINFSWHR